MLFRKAYIFLLLFLAIAMASRAAMPSDSLKTRWKIQRTTPITYDDLDQNAMDLQRPDGIKYDVIYNDTINRYIIGTRIGGTWLATPIMMTPEEYMAWSEKHWRDTFYRGKNDNVKLLEIVALLKFGGYHR